MFVPSEDMKVNRFQQVAIPRPCEYMRRFGALRALATQFTGDDIAPLPQNKVDSFAQMEAYDAMMQREEMQKQKDNE